MEFIKNFFAIASGILTLFKIYDLFKERGAIVKKIFFNQLGIALTISVFITILLFLIPWGEIHIGKQQPIKIHDTIYITKHDTIRVPVYTKQGSKTFNNKINKVDKIVEQ